MNFTPLGIEELYDSSQSDYTIYNALNGTLSPLGMHFGFWENKTRSMLEAQENENRYVYEKLRPLKQDVILDAGCGVGGVAIYLAKNYGLAIEAITISSGQIKRAERFVSKHGIGGGTIVFSKQDYHATNFTKEHFDKIYSVEAADAANPVEKFLEEMFRLLKPGGKLLILDAFLAKSREAFPKHEREVLDALCHSWALPDPHTRDYWMNAMKDVGFEKIEAENLTAKVLRTARRMRYIGRGVFPIYSFLHQLHFLNRSHYANAVAALAQGELFEKGYLEYHSMLATK